MKRETLAIADVYVPVKRRATLDQKRVDEIATSMLVRSSITKFFAPRHIPYTCMAPGPPLVLLRRDLTLRIFDIWPLYEFGTA